ncbi:hypothetical protein [Paenibacillus sp. Leaf72]|uniref:hypothetical protein n=1 Tax=Paenibacillus sp. Leaf72 TaxID=1736234 RepID=UPI0006FA061B|nr:hypothetical protein [Paenibacillus sp. Leaf72]KQN96990.1 hypothetical protein ASF12_23260 [Paenibacillus sp. Leaf72]
MISKIIDRIKKEGIPIMEVTELENERRPEFLYALVNNSYITVPRNIAILEKDETFILSHELAHYYQYKRRSQYKSHLMSTIRRLAGKGHILPKLLLVGHEMDAWVKAYHICKEENILMEGFIQRAALSVWTYIWSMFHSMIQYIKYVGTIYFGAFFLVRFISNHPTYSVDFGIVGSSAQTMETVWSIFYIMIINHWMLLLFRFTWNYLRFSSTPHTPPQLWAKRRKE